MNTKESSLVINGRSYCVDNEGKWLWSPEALSESEQKVLSFLDVWSHANPTLSASSSGTTGFPKKIELSKEAMRSAVMRSGNVLGLAKGQTALLCLSPDFIAGKMMLVRALVWQMHLIVPPLSKDPLRGLSQAVDFVAMVPAQLKSSLNHRANLAQVKTILLGGAPLMPQLLEEIKSLPVRCFHGFGMTETMGHMALRQLNGEGASDEYNCVPEITVAQDERGCLLVNLPEEQEPVKTNDRVELLDEHRFKWMGRYDHMINSGGVKIYPELLEQQLSPFIDARFYICSQEDELWGCIIALVIEGEAWEYKQEQALMKVMAEALPTYHCPKKIYYQKCFKETASGKVIREITTL